MGQWNGSAANILYSASATISDLVRHNTKTSLSWSKSTMTSQFEEVADPTLLNDKGVEVPSSEALQGKKYVI